VFTLGRMISEFLGWD